MATLIGETGAVAVWTLCVAIEGAWPGAALILLGTLCNSVVLCANGGYMPVESLDAAEEHGCWRALTERTRLRWLCDRRRLLNYSLGDLIIFLGAIILVAQGVAALL
jgi:hypothetical protein